MAIEISVTSVERAVDGSISVMFSDGAQEVVSPASVGTVLDVPYILRSVLLMRGARTSYESLPGVRVTYNPDSLRIVEVTP